MLPSNCVKLFSTSHVDSPEAARKVAKRIYDQVSDLKTMPHRGRLGAEPGTRDLVLERLPYIVTYEVIGDAVLLLRIRHGAQDRAQR